ncbi:unnamed protein product, partial [Porites evermanni]
MFSLTNRVKTDFRASLSENPLNNLIRIQMESPPLEEFDPTPAIQLWAMGATRRLNQRERKHYSARESKNRRKVLINASSTEESSGTDSEEDFEREDKDEGGKVLIAELDELDFLLETKESIVLEKKIEKNKPYVTSRTPSKTCLATKLS